MTNRRIMRRLGAVVVLGCTTALGGTAVFEPVGPATVAPGEPVVFRVTLAVESLAEFDAADVVIGTNDASDLAFEYSDAWMSSFQNVTPTVSDPHFYSQDVFVGGNNPLPVGPGIELGVVTIQTIGMANGTYAVHVNSGMDGGVSKLSLGDGRDPLAGSGVFTVQCVAVDTNCDGSVGLEEYRDLRGCLAGPGVAVASACDLFDVDGDTDVDLQDAAAFNRMFNGSPQ